MQNGVHTVLWVQHAVITRHQAHGLYQAAAKAAEALVAAATATCYTVS